jgi:large subunit ribosomal protein L24
MEERIKSRIRRNDVVRVLTGKDAGKTGKVLSVDRQSNRAVVEKINMIKRHQRQQKGKGGGIVEKEAAIHLSNLMLMNEKLNRPVRIRVKIDDQGT